MQLSSACSWGQPPSPWLQFWFLYPCTLLRRILLRTLRHGSPGLAHGTAPESWALLPPAPLTEPRLLCPSSFNSSPTELGLLCPSSINSNPKDSPSWHRQAPHLAKLLPESSCPRQGCWALLHLAPGCRDALAERSHLWGRTRSYSQGFCPTGILRWDLHDESMLCGRILRVRAQVILWQGKEEEQPQPWGSEAIPCSNERGCIGLPRQWLLKGLPCGEVASPTDTCPLWGSAFFHRGKKNFCCVSPNLTGSTVIFKSTTPAYSKKVSGRIPAYPESTGKNLHPWESTSRGIILGTRWAVKA